VSVNDPLRVFDGIVAKIRLDGAASGPLAGTTFVAKDLYDVSGCRTGAGNPDWERTHEPATQTAPAIVRLLDAGASLIGKSCSDELAFSLDGVNVHYGTPLNPRFPDRLPGGSSSGSASAVAAGLADFALGTDTSGSVRVPASYCELYGFRPSHGAVPATGVVPLAPSFDTVGWLARDAAMLGRAGRVLLGQAGRASGTGGRFEKLWVVEDAFDFLDPSHRPGLRTAVSSVRKAFGDVRHVRLTDDALGRWLATFNALKQWEAWRVHGDWIRAVNPHFAANIRQNFEAAARVTDAERESASLERERLLDSLRPYLTDDACLCLPSAWAVAPFKTAPAAELAANRIKDLTLCSIAGLARAPQVSVPTAADPAIGLSFVAAFGQDLRLLELAESLTAVVGA